MKPAWRLFLPSLLLALALAACGDTGELADAISREYGDAWVYRQAGDSTHLHVDLLSSPFAARPDSARRGTAWKIAGYVRDHYPRYKALHKVTVAFLSRKETEAGAKHPAASYSFTPAELDASRE